MQFAPKGQVAARFGAGMGGKTEWNVERLQALFDRYNDKYRAGILPKYEIKISRHGKPGDAISGCCVRESGRMSVNMQAHHNDAEVSATRQPHGRSHRAWRSVA
jgi:hypothetical protein